MVKRIEVIDTRAIIARTKKKLEIGRTYSLPLLYMNMNAKANANPVKKFTCTGKYEHFATFENHKGVPQSFTYFDLATMAKI